MAGQSHNHTTPQPWVAEIPHRLTEIASVVGAGWTYGRAGDMLTSVCVRTQLKLFVLRSKETWIGK